MPTLDEIDRHGLAHDAEPDEADIAHDFSFTAPRAAGRCDY
jgi:hypothetical protein